MPQGTVKSFDRRSGDVVILDDRLAELRAGPEAYAASGLRHLRIGQRVRFELEDADDGAERVTKLDIISL